jgi:hypothetical protein
MRRIFLIFALITVQWFISHTSAQEQWFPLKINESPDKVEFDMSHWLHKPAGKHGFVLIDGDRFVFEDGTPIKFWGTNIASEKPFMPAAEAEAWSEWLARYGFNAVRFHKFTWRATDGIQSTVVTDDKWKNFDYLCYQLREKGIYYGWSHIYGHKVMPGDSSRLLAYSEVAGTKFPWSHLNGTTASLVNFADDLQELNIELTVNMLNHVNPHTGLRYADDPALNFVEFQNEDNIFWSAIERSLEQAPTYRKLLCEKFSQWLEAKYGTQEALKDAWNNEGLPEGENLSLKNIYPQPNHGLFGWEYEQAVKENRQVKQHILDKAAFLYEEQMKFYKKFEKAVRETGYKGPLVGSCWQAGTGLAHLLNLHTDYEIGIIDRHNYFGGGQGHSLRPGPFSNESMLKLIGSGLFGSGLQQVSNRPFAFSEWMSLIPNEWTAESAPIIAIYGMGLQGWDASYVFATDYRQFTPTIQTPGGGIYNATTPTQLALYPALATAIFRNDIKEGSTVVDRRVNMGKLLEGDITFREKVEQDHDRKVLKGDFPLEAMAIGKVGITFTENEPAEVVADLTPFIKNSHVLSNTGQLMWDKSGYFTVNSPGTKGIAGFAAGVKVYLEDMAIETPNPFAVILATSLEPDKAIKESGRILITTIARAKNTGMKYNDDRTELLEVGEAPLLLEPVMVNLEMKRKGKFIVSVLDHLGRKTGQTIQPKGKNSNWMELKHKAFYYLIEYK